MSEMHSSATYPPRILLHLGPGKRRPVPPEDIAFVEAAGGDSRVRLKKGRPVVDVRPLGKIMKFLEPHGFLRVHRNHAVNLAFVSEIRRKKKGRGWELRLEPAFKEPLTVSDQTLAALWAAFGE